MAYLFLQTEKAQNRAVYCGVVKLHRANATVARNTVTAQHMTRDTFLELFMNIYGHPLPKDTAAKLKTAVKIRDKVIHGKTVSTSQLREAISDVFDYAEAVNADVYELAGFRPFGALTGFKGRGKALDQDTTRWLLKGLGFGVS